MPRRNKRSKRKKRRQDDGYLTQSLFREMTRNQVGYEAGYICYFCGTKTRKRSAQSDPRGFTVDHLTPLSRGGNWDMAATGTWRTWCVPAGIATTGRRI